MPISVVFDPPLPSDSPSTFNTKAFTLLGDLNDWSTQANALPGEVATNLTTLLAAPPAIGSTTPAAGNFTTLSAGSAVTVADGFDVRWGAGSTFIAGNSSSDVIQLAAAGAERARVSSSGLAVTGTLSVTKSGAGYQPAMLSFATPTDTSAVYRIGMATGGNLIIGRTDTSTTNVTLDASGNLGIGVTPSAWNSGGNIDGQNDFTWSSYDGSIGSNYYYNSGYKYKSTGAPVSRYAPYNGAHTWSTAPSGTAGNPISFTQAMTLDASGNLLVGTASTGLEDSKSFVVNKQYGVTYVNHATGQSSGEQYSIFAYAGTITGSIAQSGTTAVLYNTTSDQRLKENIVDAPAASYLIDAIQVRSFDWKSDGSHQRYGMVAQELYEVAPEAVHAPTDPDEMMAVDYSKLVPMLVKEIQSLRARVAQLEG